MGDVLNWRNTYGPLLDCVGSEWKSTTEIFHSSNVRTYESTYAKLRRLEADGYVERLPGAHNTVMWRRVSSCPLIPEDPDGDEPLRRRVEEYDARILAELEYLQPCHAYEIGARVLGGIGHKDDEMVMIRNSLQRLRRQGRVCRDSRDRWWIH